MNPPKNLATQRDAKNMHIAGVNMESPNLTSMHTLRDLGLKGDILDSAVLISAFEESRVSLDEIHEMFGDKTAFIVYCLSKTPQNQFQKESDKKKDDIRNYIEKLEIGSKVYPEILLLKMSEQLSDLNDTNTDQNALLKELSAHFIPFYVYHITLLPTALKNAGVILFSRLKEALGKAESKNHKKPSKVRIKTQKLPSAVLQTVA